MNESIYADGTYLQQNPTWHVEDSAWKATQILRALKQNKIEPQTVGEVGCGAGEILRQLQQHMAPSCEFHGYEISPQAYRLCTQRANEKLHFRLTDFLQEDTRFDLLLLIDVIEHMEDYFTFLRAVKDRARHKVIHLPLDLSVQALLRPGRLVQLRQATGHLHYFTEKTALHSLKDTGYEIVDSFLTPVALEAARKPLQTHLANIPRRIASVVNDSLAARLFGGYSIMVLAT